MNALFCGYGQNKNNTHSLVYTNSLTKLELIYQRKHNSTPLALLGALKKAEYLILDTGSSLDNSFFSYGTFQALPTLTIIVVSLLR